MTAQDLAKRTFNLESPTINWNNNTAIFCTDKEFLWCLLTQLLFHLLQIILRMQSISQESSINSAVAHQPIGHASSDNGINSAVVRQAIVHALRSFPRNFELRDGDICNGSVLRSEQNDPLHLDIINFIDLECSAVVTTNLYERNLEQLAKKVLKTMKSTGRDVVRNDRERLMLVTDTFISLIRADIGNDIYRKVVEAQYILGQIVLILADADRSGDPRQTIFVLQDQLLSKMLDLNDTIIYDSKDGIVRVTRVQGLNEFLYASSLIQESCSAAPLESRLSDKLVLVRNRLMEIYEKHYRKAEELRASYLDNVTIVEKITSGLLSRRTKLVVRKSDFGLPEVFLISNRFRILAFISWIVIIFAIALPTVSFVLNWYNEENTANRLLQSLALLGGVALVGDYAVRLLGEEGRPWNHY